MCIITSKQLVFLRKYFKKIIIFINQVDIIWRDNKQQILFYGQTNLEFAYLSNFYLAPFKVSGIMYPTNQHFFQSQKFQGTADEQKVIDAKTPKQAKMLGKRLKMIDKQKWPEIKENIMLCGLRAKFNQNQHLKKKLLSTGERVLREHTVRDKYWGDGGVKFIGKNRLGVLLMQVRSQLRKNENEKKEEKAKQ